jgi:L-lactate dehydrogenase complex protein LldE
VRIALFITCVNDTLFPEAGKATVRVLEEAVRRAGGTVHWAPDALNGPRRLEVIVAGR